MRLILASAALVLAAAAFNPVPVSAAGCIKGAVVGGVAGHFTHHHGLLGAAAGCAIGHHMAAKHAREATSGSSNSSVNLKTNSGR
jgi:hypothetical protein